MQRMVQAFPVLVGIVVPLASILAFLLLPLVGKRLEPVFGGSDASWFGGVVFFLLAFLLGQIWARWIARQASLRQMAATAFLGLLAILLFRLPSDEPAVPAGLGIIVWRLSITALPALVLLFSAPAVLQGWLRRQGKGIPYHMTVIANMGGVGVLMLYPFVFEPSYLLTDQAFFWHGWLVIVAGLLATAGYIFRQTTPGRAGAEPSADRFPGPVAALCAAISALAWVSLLGATHHLTAEIGSAPLAWVGPLGAYFLSYLLVFSGRWQRWMTLGALVWLAVSLTGFMVTKGYTAFTVNYRAAWWLGSLTASASFVANALVLNLRPVTSRESFSTVLAAGALAGALIAGIVVPVLLPRPTEFALASAGLLAIGLLWLNGRRELATVAVTACLILTPVIGLGWYQAAHETAEPARMLHLRDLTGHLMIKTDERSVVLSSETTTRASQLTMDAAARLRPTLYYTESTGVGRVLEKLAAARPALNVGVVGLGAGTLAAYARAADSFDFWDTDPKLHRVARENFTFLAESAGHVHPWVRDGREALATSKQDYDLIVIDTTTAAGTPAYLLTQEAIATYEARLANRHGLLVIHASSRYARLFPVVEATARSLGLAALGMTTNITGSTTTRDWDPTPTDYIIVCHVEQAGVVVSWFPNEEDNGRVKHRLTTVQAPVFNPQLIWHDDRNATLDDFELGRFLFEP